jgi:hypothetical protein
MAKKATRQVFRSMPTKEGWAMKRGTVTISQHDTQKESEAAAIKAAKAAQRGGGLGQAVLHKKNRAIREERTFGKDPERAPG